MEKTHPQPLSFKKRRAVLTPLLLPREGVGDELVNMLFAKTEQLREMSLPKKNHFATITTRAAPWKKIFQEKMLMSEHPILIRKAAMRDAEAINQMNCLLAEEAEGLKLDRIIAMAGIKAVLKDAHKGFYLLAEKKYPPGLAGLLRVSFAWDDRCNLNFWWIHNAWVQPECRGQKIFSALFRYLCDLARFHKDVAGLKLSLGRHQHAAAKIFESLGLRQTPDDLYEIRF
jgi:hypothetical protein